MAGGAEFLEAAGWGRESDFRGEDRWRKQAAYAERQLAAGRCPHCGQPCAPYKRCEGRRAAMRARYHQARAGTYVRGPYRRNAEPCA